MDISVMHVVIAKTWGGGEQYVFDVCAEMKRQGIKCYVVVDKRNEFLREKYSEVAEILTTNLYTAAGLCGLKDIVEFIHAHQIKIINCHSGHALLVCILAKRWTKAKLIMFKHNALPSKQDVYHAWQRKMVDAFICVSQLVYDLQTSGLHRKEISKYHLVYNGIDTERFQKYSDINFREKNKYIIGYAGRIAWDKGIDLLVEAFAGVAAKYTQAYLYIAGADEKGYAQHIKNLVNQLHLQNRVKFLGQVNDMEKFYKSIDLFVLPSKARESFGLVLCEAVYCGVPVITTDSGAQKEIIKSDKYGWIIHSGSKEQLYDAMGKAVLVKESTLDNRQYIEHTFSIHSCVEHLIKIYGAILGHEW